MKRFIVKRVMPSRRPMRPAKLVQRNVALPTNDNAEVNAAQIEEAVEIKPKAEENVADVINQTETKKKNKKSKKTTEMDTSEKIKVAAEILNDTKDEERASVKRVRQDKGLIERVESSKIILTEDNRELLND